MEKKEQPYELKGSNIGNKIDKNKKELLIKLFNKLVFSTRSNVTKVVFYIMHKDDLKFDKLNIENVINELLKQHTSVDKNEVHKYVYYHLSLFLIKRLHEIPFNNDYIENHCCPVNLM